MKIIYDSEVDALYVRFADALIDGSEEIADGIVFDFDAEGHLVAIELLEASKHFADAE